MFDDGVHTYLIEPLQQTLPIVSYSHVVAVEVGRRHPSSRVHVSFRYCLRFTPAEHVNVAADRAKRINQAKLGQGEQLVRLP